MMDCFVFSPADFSFSPSFNRAIRPTLESVEGRRYARWTMEDGRCRCGIPYILRKEAPRMESSKTGTALDEQTTWQYTEQPLPVLNDTGNLPRAKGSQLPYLVVILAKHLYALATYRRMMPVREYILYPSYFGTESAFFLCPRCNITMEREYQSYCDRCGQRLGWRSIEKAKERRNTF